MENIKKEKEQLFGGENETIADKYEIGFHTGFMKIYHNLWLCFVHISFEDNLDGYKRLPGIDKINVKLKTVYKTLMMKIRLPEEIQDALFNLNFRQTKNHF